MPQARELILLSAAGATGSSATWGGGYGVFYCTGTFGSGTVKLQASYDNGTTWLDVDKSPDTYVTFTANGHGEFTLPPCLVRANVSGATGASLNAGIRGTTE